MERNALKNENGTWGEMIVAAALTRDGCDVFLPWGGHTKADIIVSKDGSISKIQVKKASWQKPPHGNFEYLGAMVNHRDKYSEGDIDEYIFVSDEGDMWRVPWGDIKHIGRVILSSSNTQFKSRTFPDADKYRWLPSKT